MDLQALIDQIPIMQKKPVQNVNTVIEQAIKRPPPIVGEASTYGWGEKLNKHTANGEVFNPKGMSAAMWGVPFGTKVRVTDTNTGNFVIVPINDRGPNKRLNRPIDLSRGAWEALGYKKAGLTKVKIDFL